MILQKLFFQQVDSIQYSLETSPFGNIFLAIYQDIILQLTFLESDNIDQAIPLLQQKWPLATLKHHQHHTMITKIFTIKDNYDFTLGVIGTDFQIMVWQALLEIPFGKQVTYSDIAEKIDNPKAVRAVGSAIAANDIAFLIPCHRVIQKSGNLGNYKWGRIKKKMICQWEQTYENNNALVILN